MPSSPGLRGLAPARLMKPPLLIMLPIMSSNAPKRTVRRRPSRPRIMGSIAEATALAPRKTVTRASGSTSPKASAVSIAMGATE